MTPFLASWVLVVVFLVTWIAAAAWAGRTVAASMTAQQKLLYAAGGLFLVVVAGVASVFPIMRLRLWPPQPACDWAMVGICAAGLAMCWWARLHLGRLWSGGVVVKEGHRVVDTGPYAWVRHPIYTGAFIACLAFAFIRARPFDIILTAGFILFFALKARVEERFLREQLGPGYDAYRARVPMLVPGVWRRRSAA